VTGRLFTFLRDRKVRDVLWQAAGAIVLIALVWFFVRNASENMVKAGIASGFRFLWRDSGIEVPFNLTGYRPSDTILALLWTGIVNTLLVSAVSIAVATVIGFTVGLLRLSRNWLLSTLAAAYVEFVRNIPLLFFVLFWYFGVLAALPTPRDSLSVLDVAFLNRRGLSIPTPNDVTGLRLDKLTVDEESVFTPCRDGHRRAGYGFSCRSRRADLGCGRARSRRSCAHS